MLEIIKLSPQPALPIRSAEEVVPKPANDDQRGGCDILRLPVFAKENLLYKLRRIVGMKAQMMKVSSEFAVFNVPIAKTGEFAAKRFSGQPTATGP